MSATPLTLGTAGHVDHGKTALVRELTGVETDRLREERERGLTIVLGYAPLALPSCGRVSLIDVPGHERFVRTMVAGATGIDAFLMVVAADDGVMPQTIEHAAVLRALGVEAGVVAITKIDLADPARAAGEAAALCPDCEIVPCSSRTGAGLPALAAALDRLAARVCSRAGAGEPGDRDVRLHVDRSFTIAGRGTVLTGTLWSGELSTGQTLELAGAAGTHRQVRVRGLQIHDQQVERALAGQRVAVNVTGVRAAQARRGDVLLTAGYGYESQILDCALSLTGGHHGERVQVHHGTRDVPGRLCRLTEDLWQLRLERPLHALCGDRLVVRRLSPPDTLGGGRVLDPQAARHGARPAIVERLRRLQSGEDPACAPDRDRSARTGAAQAPAAAEMRSGAQPADPTPSRADTDADAELERLLLEAGWRMLPEARLQEHGPALRRLRAAGRAVRVSGRLYAHGAVAAAIRERIVELLEVEGSVTLAGVRDALEISRKASQAFLEHLDSLHVTRKVPGDQRVLVRRGQRAAAAIQMGTNVIAAAAATQPAAILQAVAEDES